MRLNDLKLSTVRNVINKKFTEKLFTLWRKYKFIIGGGQCDFFAKDDNEGCEKV